MNLEEKWKRSKPMTKVLFVLIVLYIAVSVYILLWGLGIVDNILTEDNNAIWVNYSIMSFGLTTILAAFHLYTMIARRKRHADKVT
jgi:membrane protein YdbS with pleckstrin-like domain